MQLSVHRAKPMILITMPAVALPSEHPDAFATLRHRIEITKPIIPQTIAGTLPKQPQTQLSSVPTRLRMPSTMAKFESGLFIWIDAGLPEY